MAGTKNKRGVKEEELMMSTATSIKTEVIKEEKILTTPEPTIRKKLRSSVKIEVKKEEEEEGEEDKDHLPAATITKKTETIDFTATAHESSPYKSHARPTPHECIRARDLLAGVHGFPKREELESIKSGGTILEKESRTVLDSLVRTILSQNTTDTLSARAFASLKEAFPTYKALLAAPVNAVEESIKSGGLAQIKVGRIRTILETILKERPKECKNGEPSMEYLRNMTTEEIKTELSRFKGVGPKTISCVLLFTLAMNDFPVDTHVWHIAKRLGWVHPSATREDTYAHLNNRVPDVIKYDLHVLMVQHGKKCRNCCKGSIQLPPDGPCPLTPSKFNAVASKKEC